MKPILFVLFAALPASAMAQASDIPAEVIAQCNEAASASDLPKCLKEGATAFEMFDLARSPEFYGPAAEPVIAACGESNELFSGQWTCFQNAAEKAAETRALIGVDNIADACVAGISDPDIAERIEKTFKLKREARFPDEMYFGGGMYYAFRGCPVEEDEVEQGAAPPSDIDAVNDALADALGTAKKADPYSGEACAVYAEMEEIISSTDAEDLRRMGQQMKAIEDESVDDLVSITGISKDAAAFIYDSGEDQIIAAAMIMGAFIETHHPALIEEFLADDAKTSNEPGVELGAEIARSMFASVLASARQGYEDNCRKN